MKTLITYFSASGVTKAVAEKIAKATDSDLFEIVPETIYTPEDLDWTNKESRSTKEMNDKAFRPPIKETIDLEEYDQIVIGFPVWWFTAPTIINTFIESTNMDGKTAIAFCTSGSTGISGCENDLKNAYPNINWKAGKRLTGRESDEELKKFIEE